MHHSELKAGRVYVLAHDVQNPGEPEYLVDPEPENAWPWWSVWPAGTRFACKPDKLMPRLLTLAAEGTRLQTRLVDASFISGLVSGLVEVPREETTVLDVVLACDYPHALLLAALEHLGLVSAEDLADVRAWLESDARSPDIRAALIDGVTPS